jgi:hypothetical protein
MLWRSQLRARGWSGLVENLQVQREWQGDWRQVRLRWLLSPTELVFVKQYDPYWTYGYGPSDETRPRQPGQWNGFRRGGFTALEPKYYFQYHFQCDTDDDVLLHALEPLLVGLLGSTVATFHEVHGWSAGGAVSAAHALLRLWLALSEPTSPDQLAATHDTCLKIAIHGFGPYDVETRRRYRQLVLRLLAMNRARLPEAFLRDATNQLRAGGRYESAELLALARKELPGLLPEDPAPPATTDG